MKTLLYFTSKITDSGGVSRVISLKTNYLADVLGYQIHIISTNDTATETFYPFSPKITFHFLDVKVKGIKSIKALKKQSRVIVKKIQPHIVLVADNGIKSLLVKKWMPDYIPCIYELHASPYYLLNEAYEGIQKYINRYFLKKYLSGFDKVVVLQKSFKWNLLDREKQLVIPNPLPFETDEINNLNHNKVIAVGRIVSLKGYERMLSAWQKVIQKYPDYVLNIYGEYSPGFDLARIINSLHLQKNVQVHPPTSQIKEKYVKADFLLHASFSESFGMVLLEAMQCGLPVVCYDIGTHDFLNKQNSLVAANEPGFVAAILTLIENTALRKEMGRYAKQASDAYRLPAIMHYWEVLFNDIK